MSEPKPNTHKLEQSMGVVKNEHKHTTNHGTHPKRLVQQARNIPHTPNRTKTNLTRTLLQPNARAKRRNHTRNAQSNQKTIRTQKITKLQPPLGPTKPTRMEKNMKQKAKVPNFKIIKCAKCKKNAMWGITTEKVEIQYCPNCGSAQMKWNQKLKGKL